MKEFLPNPRNTQCEKADKDVPEIGKDSPLRSQFDGAYDLTEELAFASDVVRAYREYGKGEEFSSWLRNSLADGALDFGEVRDESGAIVSMPENFSPEAAATLAQELARGKSVEGVVSMLEEHVRSLSERGEAEYGADKAALVKAATAETHKRSGSRWKSWTMSGKAVEGTYRIVDAQAVRFRDSASSEERNFQGRDRGSKQSEAQVYKIADELNPERLGANDYTDRGAPIVNGELYSVAGEGRTRAIRTAYGLMPNASGRALENGKAYRAFVEKFAREHGLEIPADVKHPMIVRVMERSDVSESELTKDTNRDVKADHSRAEAANENAEYVASLLPLWNPGKNGDPRAASNAAFMNAFMAKIGKDTSGAMFDIDASGRKVWTEEAAELVLDAVFAHVVNDVELVRRMFRNPRRYGGAYDGVYRTAFELVELNGSAYALGNSLRDALIKYEELKRARENTPSGKTLTLEDFLAQGELGLSGETGAIDGLTRALLETFDAFSDARGNGVRRVLHSYAQQAMRLDSGAEADMLVGAGEKPSAESVLRAGLAVMKGESVSPHSIYGALYERGDDGSLAKPTLFQRGGGDMRRTTAQDTRRILDRVKNWIPNAKVKIVKNVRDAVRQANSVRESRVFNDRFNSELEAFENGTIKGELHLGSPGEILRACGLGSSEIFIKPTVLRQHISKHGITVSDIQNLPEALNDPLMVYEWGTKAKSLIVITDLTVKDGRKITAAVKLERDGKRVEVNELASVHGKSAERLLNEATEKESDFGKNKLKYVDKGKAAEWLSNIPPKGTTERTRQLHLRNIIERFENPSTENSPEARYQRVQLDASPFPLAPKSEHAAVKVGENMPVPFAGNKKTIIEAHPELFERIGKLAKLSGGKVIDAFAGAGTYTAGLGTLGALPKGSILNEWAVSRYVMHRMLAKNPQGVSEAVRELVSRFSESAELEAFRQKLDDVRNGKAEKTKLTQPLVDWFNDELSGKHGVKYIEGNENSAFGDANLIENERSAAFYMFLQTLMTGSHPVNFKFNGEGKLFIEVADGVFRTGHLSTRLIGAGNKFNENVLKPEKYTKRIEAAGKIYQGAELDVRRGDGWALAKTAQKGDVVFVDPAYLGVQSYGGKENVDATDANNKEKAVARLSELVNWADAHGVSIVYTNEYSDKSATGGMSQAEYAEVWKEALKRIDSDKTSVNYFNREARGMGKAGEARADIVVASGEAAHLLKTSRAELDQLKERHGFETDAEAENYAWEAKTRELSDAQKAEAEEWKSVRWLRNRLGEAFGAYLPATGEIFIAENARADTVLHELGWHATYAWARANNPQLYAKMREYALTAPAEVRERVAKDYGREDGKISDEEFVDEVGAALFGDENADKVEALLQTKEARTWWAKLKEAAGKLWRAFLTAVGGNRADVRAMAEMSPREAMNKLAEEFLAGKRLAAMNERAEADAREAVRWQQDAGTREEPQDLEASAQKYSVLVRQIGTLLTAGMLRKGLNMDGKFAQEGISKTETTTPQDKAMEYARKLFKGESDAVLLDAVDYAREAAGNILDKRAALGKGLFRSSKEAFAAIKTARQEERFRTKFSRKLRELASVNLDPVKFARAQAFVERRNRLKKQGRLSETKALTDKELAARNVPPPDIATLAGAESAEWAERVKSAVYEGKEADDADALNQLRETLYRAYAAAAKNSALDSATAAAVARRAERMRASANTLNQVMAAAERSASYFCRKSLNYAERFNNALDSGIRCGDRFALDGRRHYGKSRNVAGVGG